MRGSNFIVIALGVILTCEFIRRFYYFSSSVYMLMDTVVVLLFLFVSAQQQLMKIKIVLMVFGVCFWIGLFNLFGAPNFLPISYLGVRPILYFVMFYIVGQKVMALNDWDRGVNRSILLFLVLVTGVGIVQVYLGITHPINELPGEFEDQYRGVGYYTDSRLSFIPGGFRPTSIFMHTGRFGQFVGLLSVALVVSCWRQSLRSKVFVGVIVIAALIVSGQRAAFMLVGLTVLGLLLADFASKKIQPIVSFSAFLSAYLIISFAILYGVGGDDIQDGLQRLVGFNRNVDTLLNEFAFDGRGLGYFTYGSAAFGGQSWIDYALSIGAANETSVWRILGELGAVGAIIFVATFTFLFWREYGSIHLLGSVFIGVLTWTQTHDLLANYLSMAVMGMMLARVQAYAPALSFERNSKFRRYGFLSR